MRISEYRRLLAVSALVTFSVGILAGIERGNDLPTARFLIGMGLAFTICSVATDLGSGVGAGFALLIMVSAILSEGDDAFKLLGRRSGAAPVTAKKTNSFLKRAAKKNKASPNNPFPNWSN